MRDVLISIQPKWVHPILEGTKLVEVRKNLPSQMVPFRCWIYCTKAVKTFQHGCMVEHLDDLYRLPTGELKFGYSGELMTYPTDTWGQDNFLNGKVVASFMCRSIEPYWTTNKLGFGILSEESLVSKDELLQYANGSQVLYGWTISDLCVLEKPMLLSEFGIERAPQSWRYLPTVKEAVI